MYMIRQALLSIKGQWIKSLLLMVIVSLSGVILFSSYLINETSKQDMVSLKENIGINGTIKHHFKKDELMSDSSKIASFSLFLDKLKTMEGIKQVDYLRLSQMNYGEIAEVYDANNNALQVDDSILIGLSSPTSNIFNQEIASLNSGRHFTPKEISDGGKVAMIYADDSKNSNSFYSNEGEGLKEGATILLRLPISWDDEGIPIEYVEEELEIVGTYKKDKDINYMWCKLNISGNECLDTKILIPGKLFDSIELKNPYALPLINNDILDVDVTIDMTSDLDEIIGKIEDSIRKSGGKYTYRASDDLYNQLLPVLEGMEKNSKLVFIVGLFLSLCAVMSIMYIFIKERQRELWVYRALGKYQFEVMGQIMIEVSILTLIALVMSISVGTIITRALVQDTLSMGSTSELFRTYVSFAFILLGMTMISTLPPCLYFTRATAKRRM